MEKKKKNRKILAQMGLLVAIMFALSALINGIFIYRSSSKNYIEMLESHTEHVLQQTRKTMEAYRSLPWLLDYWQTHYQEMELPGDMTQRNGAVMRLLLDKGIDAAEAVTPEQAALFSASEQRQFAEYCYLQIMPGYYTLKSSFSLETLYCTSMPTMERAFPFFQAQAEGESTSYGNFCALGEHWPFNAPLHPAIGELYAQRENRVYFERVTSTVNGVEYLFGYIPILQDGEIRCHICASYAMTQIKESIAQDLQLIEWVNILVMAVAAAMLLYLIYWTVLRNLSFVQKNVRAYREDKDSAAVVEKMGMITSGNEVERLAEDFSAMAVELDRYTSDMVRLSAEKERIGTELALATRIQVDTLPKTYPAFPERPEFEIYATMNTAKEVGGDFYDYFSIDDNRICFLIADVSGKGVPAALFMMTAKTMIKDYALTCESTAEIFTTVNARLCENNEAGMFATAWIGILDVRTMTLQYTNAGHNYPILQRQGQTSELKKVHGLFLAGLEFTHYRQDELQLEPGDRLLLYTDGVTEAHDRTNGLYGTDRLEKVIKRTKDSQGEEVLKQVLEDVNEFAQGVPQFDDITMMVLSIK